MPHDPIRIADTRGWLAKSQSDLRLARHALTAQPTLYEHVVYHCQQAAEKTLKGFLAWQDRPFPKTHDLGELGKMCADCDPSLEPSCRRAEVLTGYAWMFRYPGEPGEPTREETLNALALAEELYAVIVGRLPQEVRP